MEHNQVRGARITILPFYYLGWEGIGLLIGLVKKGLEELRNFPNLLAWKGRVLRETFNFLGRKGKERPTLVGGFGTPRKGLVTLYLEGIGEPLVT